MWVEGEVLGNAHSEVSRISCSPILQGQGRVSQRQQGGCGQGDASVEDAVDERDDDAREHDVNAGLQHRANERGQ